MKRIRDLQTATLTFKNASPPYVGPDALPTADQIKAIRKFEFDIEGDWPALEAAVNAQIQALKVANPTYTFSAKFGYVPTTQP